MAAGRAVRRCRKSSKALDHCGLCSGAVVAGRIGTGPGAVRQHPPSDFTCPSGSYPNGISVAQPGGATTPLNVTLQSGVNVTGPASNGSGNAVDIVNDVSGTKTSVVMEKGATINVAGSLTGLHVQQGFPGTINTPSDATVTANGTINVQSNGLRQDAIGVFTTANGASATVN